MSTKKKTTENSTTVTTPTNPQWVTDGMQTAMQRIMGLGAQDPYSFAPRATPLQTQAFDIGAGLGGQIPGYFDAGQALARQATAPQQAIASATIAPVSYAEAASARDGIAGYANPYEQAVVDATMADLNRGRQMALADTGRSAVLAGQYGGSRQGVAEGLTNSEFLRNLGSTVGNLRHSGFNTALQYSNADADRQQQTSIFNAGADNARSLAQAQLDQQAALANQDAADAAAARQLQGAQFFGQLGQYGVGALGELGASQQALDAAYRRAPLDLIQSQTGMIGDLPLNLLTGSTVTRNGTTTDKQYGLGHAFDAAGAFAKNIGLSFPRWSI